MAFPVSLNNTLSSDSNQQHHQENINVERLLNPPGEGNYLSEDNHTLYLSLAPQPLQYLQVQDDLTYQGLYHQGGMLITPVNTPLFVRWEGEEDCLQIQIKRQFLQHIAQETCIQDCDRLKLMPQFQVRDQQLEAIARMLLTEHQQEQPMGQLYLDSLANILAVNLLRYHTIKKPDIPSYQGGLPPRHLKRILDYIDAHLDQEIQLANLAQLLDISQFHFSRLFKQSTGNSPYQYLIQQRIERAKCLLKETDQPIMEIAFDCGFNSHSHLTKRFRQVMGITPKEYRGS
ncbi:MAG: helix-turn-helix domain-containing protein [Microcystaceae cyanobacterium]